MTLRYIQEHNPYASDATRATRNLRSVGGELYDGDTDTHIALDRGSRFNYKLILGAAATLVGIYFANKVFARLKEA